MGMGGGTILILLLSTITKLNQKVAQATNIVFFVPTALAAIIIGIKDRNIKWKIAMQIVISGVIGAIISANLATKMNVNLLRKLFGFFLIIMAVYEIYNINKVYKKKE